LHLSRTSKVKILTVIILVFLILLGFIPHVFAKQRKTYLTDFSMDNLIEDEGFANSQREDYRKHNDKVSYEATAYALKLLGKYDLLEKKDLFGKVEKSYNSSDMQDHLEETLDSQFNTGTQNLYDTLYVLTALNEMDTEVSSGLNAKISSYLSSLSKSTGGFGGSVGSTASLSATYYAFGIYYVLDKAIPNLALHKGFITSCKKADGGFGGNYNSSSTLTSTYHAILMMQIIDDFGILSRPDLTERYLNSFYVDNENDEDNFGGYLPDLNAKYALISSTYYCITALSLIEDAEFEDDDATAQWILNRQNFQDGGFCDISDGSEQKFSSLINSYFAYEVIITLGKESLLEEEVFQLEFEWYDWIIFCSIIGGLCILAIAAVIIWRRRRI